MQALAGWAFVGVLVWFMILGPIFGGLDYSLNTGEMEFTWWFQLSGLIVLGLIIVAAIATNIRNAWQKRRGKSDG